VSGHVELPAYTQAEVKAALLQAGACGTIYSLVMPESEQALAYVVDGCERDSLLGASDAAARMTDLRRKNYFSRYHEPWTQKQDAMHEAYFSRWLKWAAPIVWIRADDFPHRYPTAGASEGIFKIMAEYSAACHASGITPSVHVFEGEYEGFSAYAAALRIRTVAHPRDDWRDVPARLERHAQFWVSQPSAIDGNVWSHFGDFVSAMGGAQPDVQVIPDLTYVGGVARDFHVDLDHPNIPAIVISHSKPFGGYYHRVGGVFSRREYLSLFGNKWFKNLQSLAWGTEMMKRHGVYDLPRKYRSVQEAAVETIARRLEIEGLAPADVLLLGIAPPPRTVSPLLSSVLRGSGRGRVIRLCLTPAMTCLIDPAMAPEMMRRLESAVPDDHKAEG
jgi:hypothetical protein